MLQFLAIKRLVKWTKKKKSLFCFPRRTITLGTLLAGQNPTQQTPTLLPRLTCSTSFISHHLLSCNRRGRRSRVQGVSHTMHLVPCCFVQRLLQLPKLVVPPNKALFFFFFFFGVVVCFSIWVGLSWVSTEMTWFCTFILELYIDLHGEVLVAEGMQG